MKNILRFTSLLFVLFSLYCQTAKAQIDTYTNVGYVPAPGTSWSAATTPTMMDGTPVGGTYSPVASSYVEAKKAEACARAKNNQPSAEKQCKIDKTTKRNNSVSSECANLSDTSSYSVQGSVNITIGGNLPISGTIQVGGTKNGQSTPKESCTKKYDDILANEKDQCGLDAQKAVDQVCN